MKVISKILFLTLSSFFIFSASFGQTSKPKTTKNAVDKVNTTNSKLPLIFEKVYLHLDRELYTAGDDIWFNAYLVNAQSNYFSSNSNNLYVELISPEQTIVSRIVVRLENGIGNGDFKLSDSISKGKYRLRAYTKWMLNYGDNFIFSKEISIHSSAKKNQEKLSNSEKKELRKEESEKSIRISSEPEIQFTPEGGSLLANVTSLVGFKSVDEFGNGYQSVNGYIIDSKNDTITEFKSFFQGMGTFSFTPAIDEKYYAVGMSDNKPFRKSLPTTYPIGYVLRINNNSDTTFSVYISTNDKTLEQHKNDELTLLISTFHLPTHILKFKMEKSKMMFRISKKSIPTGISRITILDSKNKPYCERAIYIDQKESNITLTVKPEKENYEPREEIVIKIKALDTKNNPIAASLSLSVTDAVTIHNSSNNIVSYLMLESEVKGKIENPTYYFDSSNANRYKMLDLLLLTQGWRDFVWKNIADTIPKLKLKYIMEQGLEISGQLNTLLFNKPLIDKEISMKIQPVVTLENSTTKKKKDDRLINEKYNEYLSITRLPIYKTKTDNLGTFVFTGLTFYGNKEVSMRAYKSKSDDIKGAGVLSINPIYVTPFKIDKPKYFSKIMPQIEVFAKEVDRKEKIMRKYTLKDTVLLEEVLVKERKIDDLDEFHYIGRNTFIYKSFEFTTKDFLGYTKLDELLYDKISGTSTTDDGELGYKLKPNMTSDKHNNDGSVLGELAAQRKQTNVSLRIKYFDDPKYYSKGFIYIPSDYPLEKVEKIIVNINRDIKHSDYLSITIYCKHGVQPKNDNSSIVTVINGYNAARVFYSNNYKVISKNDLTPDLRSTVYWNPTITTNANGEAEIRFFNGDMKTKIRTTVEGLTSNGIPVVSTMYYNVK